MKKVLWWVTMNAGLAALVWAGFIAGVEGARYVVAFFVWVFCLPLGLIAAASDELQKGLAKEPATPIRSAVGRVVAWATLGTLVWTGSIATGAAWAVWMLCCALAKEGTKKHRAALAASAT